jgi:hypothetical protein
MTDSAPDPGRGQIKGEEEWLNPGVASVAAVATSRDERP